MNVIRHHTHFIFEKDYGVLIGILVNVQIKVRISVNNFQPGVCFSALLTSICISAIV